jgi:hypothetical protein
VWRRAFESWGNDYQTESFTTTSSILARPLL